MGKLVFCILALSWAVSATLGYTIAFPTAPAAGEENSTAIHMGSDSLVGWADGYTNLVYGESVASQWRVPAHALGKAQGISSDIVCLGRGGQITMVFSQGIADGDGFDFAVFENGFNDTFLELAWVEVSSDGIHFVRFPNFSDTPKAVGAFGNVNPVQIYGFAGKYRQGYGTPFDLAELHAVSGSIAAGGHGLTADYVAAFGANMPYLDTAQVKYVRLIDVVGGGMALDCEGYSVYDPYPTSGSAGFDLDAVGVINQPEPDGLPQQIAFPSIPHQKLAFGAVSLKARADSGLPVSCAVQSGPATVTNSMLFFSGTGIVEVVASQPGDATYAPAAPVLRSFVVAEEIQHVFVEPVAHQLQGGGPVQVYAYSSSGLPVGMEVFSGPASVVVGPTNHVLDLGDGSGAVMLRAHQAGNASVAPAEDVFVEFNIIEPGASNAPVAFSEWFAANPPPGLVVRMSEDSYGRPTAVLGADLDMRASARCRVMQSADLLSWTNSVPETVERTVVGDILHLSVQVPAASSNRFFRLRFEEP